jgi:hypothetical protein
MLAVCPPRVNEIGDSMCVPRICRADVGWDLRSGRLPLHKTEQDRTGQHADTNASLCKAKKLCSLENEWVGLKIRRAKALGGWIPLPAPLAWSFSMPVLRGLRFSHCFRLRDDVEHNYGLVFSSASSILRWRSSAFRLFSLNFLTFLPRAK